MTTEDNVRVGVLPLGKVVWRFISERSMIISVGLSFRNLQTPDIFPKIITMGVRTENKMRLACFDIMETDYCFLTFLGLRS